MFVTKHLGASLIKITHCFGFNKRKPSQGRATPKDYGVASLVDFLTLYVASTNDLREIYTYM